MRSITKAIYSAFAVVILVMGGRMASGAPGDIFASINNGPGNGVGAIYKYTPGGVQTAVASGLSRPRGVAFDSAGNLFVATDFFNFTPSRNVVGDATILKIAPNGAQTVFATIPAFVAQGLAIDHLDNVFVMTSQSLLVRGSRSVIYKFTPNGVRMPFGSVPGQQSF